LRAGPVERFWLLQSVLGFVLLGKKLFSNEAWNNGGGAFDSTLYDCTLTGNRADLGGGAGEDIFPGGSTSCTLYNCIVYDNSATNGPNYSGSTFFQYSCTTPLAPGPGNIDVEPGFLNQVAGDLHLLYDSPCIDAGTNLSPIVTNDLDGKPRLLDGNGDGFAAFDMGAYEFDLRTIVPPNWFVRYGLDPTDPHVLSGDPDSDAFGGGGTTILPPEHGLDSARHLHDGQSVDGARPKCW
jgi:hypothetical protein